MLHHPLDGYDSCLVPVRRAVEEPDGGKGGQFRFVEINAMHLSAVTSPDQVDTQL